MACRYVANTKDTKFQVHIYIMREAEGSDLLLFALFQFAKFHYFKVSSEKISREEFRVVRTKRALVNINLQFYTFFIHMKVHFFQMGIHQCHRQVPRRPRESGLLRLTLWSGSYDTSLCLLSAFVDKYENNLMCNCYFKTKARQDGALVNNATGYIMSWLARHRPEIRRIKIFSDGVWLFN